jgi:hypothetical protein
LVSVGVDCLALLSLGQSQQGGQTMKLELSAPLPLANGQHVLTLQDQLGAPLVHFITTVKGVTLAETVRTFLLESAVILPKRANHDERDKGRTSA